MIDRPPAENDEENWVDLSATNGWVRVRRGTLAHEALDPERRALNRLQQVEAGEMNLSLGHLADLAWMLVPELRPGLVAEIAHEANTAVEQDRHLVQLELWRVLDLVYDALVEAIAAMPATAVAVEHCVDFIRNAVRIDSRNDGTYSNSLHDNLFSRLSVDQVRVLAQFDQDLVINVGKEYGWT